MRKRLRKKLNQGEFTRWGVEVRFAHTASTVEEHVAFLREMLRALHPLHVFQGGGGMGPENRVFLGRSAGGRFDRELALWVEWLEQHPDVSEVRRSPYLEEGREGFDFESGQVTTRTLAPGQRRAGPATSRRARRQRRAALGLGPQTGRRRGLHRQGRYRSPRAAA